ncbi:uncharacterized protein BJ171DRAFT_565061, partial [Polychytrium aggregatum]|uniref:uncharacterized protein n=1 Tax=Polychytrium aggregatum TaxID=110093 RepID=UPI0022FE7694
MSPSCVGFCPIFSPQEPGINGFLGGFVLETNMHSMQSSRADSVQRTLGCVEAALGEAAQPAAEMKSLEETQGAPAVKYRNQPGQPASQSNHPQPESDRAQHGPTDPCSASASASAALARESKLRARDYIASSCKIRPASPTQNTTPDIKGPPHADHISRNVSGTTLLSYIARASNGTSDLCELYHKTFAKIHSQSSHPAGLVTVVSAIATAQSILTPQIIADVFGLEIGVVRECLKSLSLVLDPGA